MFQHYKFVSERKGLWPPPTPYPSNPYGYLTSGSSAGSGGGQRCESNTIVQFSPAAHEYARKTDILWFGGDWEILNKDKPGRGGPSLPEFPQDPRACTDPAVPIWL